MAINGCCWGWERVACLRPPSKLVADVRFKLGTLDSQLSFLATRLHQVLRKLLNLKHCRGMLPVGMDNNCASVWGSFTCSKFVMYFSLRNPCNPHLSSRWKKAQRTECALGVLSPLSFRGCFSNVSTSFWTVHMTPRAEAGYLLYAIRVHCCRVLL